MMLALKHPGKFAAVAAHSGALQFAHKVIEGHPEINPLAAALPKGKYDVFRLARKVVKSRKKPAVRFDCGVDDFVLDANRAFHAYLEKIGYAHEYAEPPGEHTWDYSDLHIRESLRFIWRNLAKK